jgi:hypothetical protein
MREAADAERQRESVGESASPRLQIRVAQPREPRIVRGQRVDLFEEPERDDERRKGMRDRRVAPVEHAQPLATRIDVRVVEVIVLQRLGHAVGSELVAQLSEARGELAQQADLVLLERQRTLQQVFVSRRQRRKPQVGDAVCEVVVRMRGLAALELGVLRQCNEPRLRRVAEHADRRPRVGEEEPGALLVVAEDLGDSIGPPREELGREPRLERLHGFTGLEPRNAVRERHAQHRRPRALMCRLDRAGRFDVRADPVFGGGAVQMLRP